jgi:hypothetical protein
MGKRIETDHPMCPSAQPGMDQAQVLGVVNRTAEGSSVSYLNATLRVTEEVLQLVSPAPPLRVLRIAARCEEERCTHFDGQICTLASRIVETLAVVTDSLPPCVVRKSCRWFAEQGRPACVRCPQIVTEADRDRTNPRLGPPQTKALADRKAHSSRIKLSP